MLRTGHEDEDVLVWRVGISVVGTNMSTAVALPRGLPLFIERILDADFENDLLDLQLFHRDSPQRAQGEVKCVPYQSRRNKFTGQRA